MADFNLSQVRAHKKNYGAIMALEKQIEQLRKDERKSLQNIDQQALDAHKFLGKCSLLIRSKFDGFRSKRDCR